MAAGFPPGSTLSKANQEWVIDFCRFRLAWILPPQPGGKAKGEGIYIAHPDTGPTDHPELPDPIPTNQPELPVPGYRRAEAINFYEPQTFLGRLRTKLGRPRDLALPANDPLTGPFPSHGTSIASVIVSPIGHADGTVPAPDSSLAPEDPNAFVSGVAPLATVIPFRIADTVLLDDNSDSALVDCINHCIALQKPDPYPIDIAVMSVSLGRPPWLGGVENKLKNALQAARERGIVICAAAGQALEITNFLDPIFPGMDPNTICVAACTETFDKLATGHYGPAVDITAPGVDIWRAQSRLVSGSQTPEYVVAPSTGSSYATGIVAGACALWQAHHGRDHLKTTYGPELILRLFKHCLQESATRPLNWDSDNRGAGVLDAESLLRFSLPTKSFVESLPAA